MGTNRYKIGMTQQGRMAKRLDELSGSQAAFPVQLITHIDVSDRYQVEAELHQRFKAFRKHGEWFEFPRGSKEVERVMGQYGGISHKSGLENNAIDQGLLCQKVEATVQEAIAAIERGQKPVIAIANTMAVFIKQYADNHSLNPGDAITSSFGDVLGRYLE